MADKCDIRGGGPGPLPGLQGPQWLSRRRGDSAITWSAFLTDLDRAVAPLACGFRAGAALGRLERIRI